MDTGMNEKRPQQVGTSWGRLFFRWGLGAETGSPWKTRGSSPVPARTGKRPLPGRAGAVSWVFNDQQRGRFTSHPRCQTKASSGRRRQQRSGTINRSTEAAFSCPAIAQGVAQPLLHCHLATPPRPCDRNDPPVHAQDRRCCRLRRADRVTLVLLISSRSSSHEI